MVHMDRKSKNVTIGEVSSVFSQHSGELHINNFPFEILKRILKYFSFGEIAKLRLVSKLFNEICGDLLNSEFYRLKTAVQVRYTYVKSQMPRRESSRRKHILSRENDIVETLHMRLALLNLTIGKHVERNHCCFFAGEVLDEVNRLLHYVNKTLNLNRAFKVTDELFDLSTMAVDYFKEHIEPALPEVIYFTDFIGNSVTGRFKSGTCTTSGKNKVPGAQPEPILTLSELNDSLENELKVANRNRISISTIKSSIKSLNESIAILEDIVHQIKKEQNGWKEIDIPNKCLKELLNQLIQCTLMIDSFKSQLPDSQRINKLSSIKHIEHNNSVSDNYENSNSSNCASTSQNMSCEIANHNSEHHSISCKSVASTSTVYNKRKDNEDINEKITKKRKT